jgi:hypothetical protein
MPIPEGAMLAVTTRNRLRSARFCLPMLRARRVIAHQLASTPGLIRYASGVVSPTEFLTLTVWEDRAAMQAFIRSGAHERLMWLFTRWTAGFWGMRWEPSADEMGAWDGLRLSRAPATVHAVSPLVAVGLLPPNPPRAGPLGPRHEGGVVEPRDCGLVAVTARLTGVGGLLSVRRTRRRLAAEAADNPDLVRWAVGADLPPQALLVSLWRDSPAARARALAVLGRDPCVSWAMCWQPADYEIGHWAGLRLRQTARRAARDSRSS